MKVERKVFGNSYLIRLDNSPLLGLLHKTQIPSEDEVRKNAEGDGVAENQEEDETKDPSSDEAKKRALKKGK